MNAWVSASFSENLPTACQGGPGRTGQAHLMALAFPKYGKDRTLYKLFVHYYASASIFKGR